MEIKNIEPLQTILQISKDKKETLLKAYTSMLGPLVDPNKPKGPRKHE